MNFSLNIKPKLNKNLILSRITEEQIFSYYLRVSINKKLFRSPLRKDAHPTCSIYKNNNGTLYFKDFATGEHLDCINLVCKLFNCDYYQALRIIANDFNIIPDNNIVRNKGKIISKTFKVEEKEFSKVQVEIQDFTELELKWWNKYGITLDILNKFNIYSCKHVFLNDQLIAKSQQHCPIFGYYGGKIKQNGQKYELWRCYFPKRKDSRFISNYPSKKIQGYNQLPKSGKLLVITKSMKDVACLYSLGITAIAPCSENQFVSDSVLEDLKNRFNYIIVLYDLDHTGIQFSKKIKKNHPELVVTLLPRADKCKDISDYYKTFGRVKTIQMIKKKIELWHVRRKNSI